MNRLIVFEGLPCTGKSTTSKIFADKINGVFYDEGSGDHPADHEFHAFIKYSELNIFAPNEQDLIKNASV